MMHSSHKIYLFLLLILLSFSNCEKSNPNSIGLLNLEEEETISQIIKNNPQISFKISTVFFYSTESSNDNGQSITDIYIQKGKALNDYYQYSVSAENDLMKERISNLHSFGEGIIAQSKNIILLEHISGQSKNVIPLILSPNKNDLNYSSMQPNVILKNETVIPSKSRFINNLKKLYFKKKHLMRKR